MVGVVSGYFTKGQNINFGVSPSAIHNLFFNMRLKEIQRLKSLSPSFADSDSGPPSSCKAEQGENDGNLSETLNPGSTQETSHANHYYVLREDPNKSEKEDKAKQERKEAPKFDRNQLLASNTEV